MIKFSERQQIPNIFDRLVSFFQVVGVSGRVKVLSKMHVYFAVFCFVVAVLAPCRVKINSLFLSEVLAEFLISHDMPGEIFFKNFYEGLSRERMVVDAKPDGRVNLCEDGVKNGLKLNDCFLELFTVSESYGSEIPDKSSDARKKEIKEVVDATLVDIRHRQLSSALWSAAGALSGLAFFAFIISRLRQLVNHRYPYISDLPPI